jgi:DNA-directed RNA polymerase specialized sigma24 family protein
MPAYDEQLQSCLVGLVQGRLTGNEGLARALRRVAARALRDARGGRRPSDDDLDDLVQEFLVKVLTLRGHGRATKLEAEWAAKPPRRFSAYVRAMLKNLAVDANPLWDVQRALRAVVTAAVEDGLPAAKGMPASVEKGGRFVRALVAAACAELVARGTTATAPALTSSLMETSALGLTISWGTNAAEVASPAPNPLQALDAGAMADAVARSFLSEAGAEGQRVLSMRALGFAEMARRLDLALSTAHARYLRVEATLRRICRRLGANREAARRAIELLSLPRGVA